MQNSKNVHSYPLVLIPKIVPKVPFPKHLEKLLRVYFEASSKTQESQSEMKVGICPGIAMFEIGISRVASHMYQMWPRILCRTWGPFIRPLFHCRMYGHVRGRLLCRIKKKLFILGTKRGRRANNRICYGFVWTRARYRGLWRGNLSSSIFCKLPRGLPWSWSYGSWIYNYLCNQCISPVTCDRLFVFPGDSGFLTNKTDCHDITEILLKVH